MSSERRIGSPRRHCQKGGQRCTKAEVPARRVPGPLRPPAPASALEEAARDPWWLEADIPTVQVDPEFSRGGKTINITHMVLISKYVLHFFSGQRRPHDVQDAIETRIRDRALESTVVWVLSIDVAISEEGDLLDRSKVELFVAVGAAGALIAIKGGPPCESFCALRGIGVGPNVVRSLVDLLGLAGPGTQGASAGLFGQRVAPSADIVLVSCAQVQVLGHNGAS